MAAKKKVEEPMEIIIPDDDDDDDDDVCIVENEEEVAEYRKNEGNRLYTAKEYAKALKCYSDAIRSAPNNASYYGNRSACYMMLSDHSHALADAKKSVELDPKFMKGHVRIIKCCVVVGDVHGAENAIRTAKTVDPSNHHVAVEEKNLTAMVNYHNSALKSMQSKDYRHAMYFLDKALEYGKCCVTYKTMKAECLVFLKRYEEAQMLASDVLNGGNSRNVDALYVRGMVLHYLENFDKAINHFQMALRWSPDHAKSQAFYKKTKLLSTKKEAGTKAFQENQYDEALKLYTEALQVDPIHDKTNAKLYFNRATVYFKLGNTKASLDDCVAALKLDPDYLKASLRKAKCLMVLEEYEEAVREYELVYKKDRTNANKILLEEAKLTLKRSKMKDYYKILGINRDATSDDIKKAYRKKALLCHPDRFADADESQKKEKEKEFKELGEAYGVLSDPVKKNRFDCGQDLDEPFTPDDSDDSASDERDHVPTFFDFFGLFVQEEEDDTDYSVEDDEYSDEYTSDGDEIASDGDENASDGDENASDGDQGEDIPSDNYQFEVYFSDGDENEEYSSDDEESESEASDVSSDTNQPKRRRTRVTAQRKPPTRNVKKKEGKVYGGVEEGDSEDSDDEDYEPAKKKNVKNNARMKSQRKTTRNVKKDDRKSSARSSSECDKKANKKDEKSGKRKSNQTEKDENLGAKRRTARNVKKNVADESEKDSANNNNIGTTDDNPTTSKTKRKTPKNVKKNVASSGEFASDDSTEVSDDNAANSKTKRKTPKNVKKNAASSGEFASDDSTEVSDDNPTTSKTKRKTPKNEKAPATEKETTADNSHEVSDDKKKRKTFENEKKNIGGKGKNAFTNAKEANNDVNKRKKVPAKEKASTQTGKRTRGLVNNESKDIASPVAGGGKDKTKSNAKKNNARNAKSDAQPRTRERPGSAPAKGADTTRGATKRKNNGQPTANKKKKI